MNADDRLSSDRPLPDGADIRLPWHLGLPTALERSFQVYLLSLSRTLIRSSFVIVLMLLLAGSMVEVLVDPDSALHSWRARLLAIMAATFAWWSATPDRPGRLLQPAVCFTAITISLSNNYLSATLDHELSYIY